MVKEKSEIFIISFLKAWRSAVLYGWEYYSGGSVKNMPAIWEPCIWSLGWEDLLEEGMATHSSILAWRISMDRGSRWPTYSPLGHKESNTTQRLSTAHSTFPNLLFSPLLGRCDMFPWSWFFPWCTWDIFIANFLFIVPILFHFILKISFSVPSFYSHISD